MNINNFQKSLRDGDSLIRILLYRTSARVLLFAITMMTLLLISCREQKKQSVDAANKDVYYTCSMHPQVHESHPGNCPVCGMKLIAVPAANRSGDGHHAIQVQLSRQQIRLGNIQADTIGKESIADKLLLTGTLNFNQDALSSISARTEGRVDKLYFRNVGDYVAMGAKLYDIYSEPLNNAKQEYVTALQQKSSMGNTLINYDALVKSAATKLRLWGMTHAQIDELAQSKQVPTRTSFYSTAAGYITSLPVHEGDYVSEGGTIVELANLSTLWAEAQVYTTQMAAIGKNDKATVQIPDLHQTFDGTIGFINPEISPYTRINLVRVTVPNQDHQLHPGMPAYIIISKKRDSSITLPADAVLRDSRGASVWIQTKPGVYTIRMVKTGIAENDKVEITEGLTAGEVVVTRGAYLLNSEYIFQHGTDPMAGMKM